MHFLTGVLAEKRLGLLHELAPAAMRAAEAALPFERPKLAAVISTNLSGEDFGDRLEAARRRATKGIPFRPINGPQQIEAKSGARLNPCQSSAHRLRTTDGSADETSNDRHNARRIRGNPDTANTTQNPLTLHTHNINSDQIAIPHSPHAVRSMYPISNIPQTPPPKA